MGITEATKNATFPTRHASLTTPSPLLILTLVWLAVVLIRHLPFFNFPRLGPDIIAFLAAAWAVFAFGYFLAFHARRSRPSNFEITTSSVKVRKLNELGRIILYFALAGVVGAAMRGIDISLLRGLDFSGGISYARLENIEIVANTGAGARLLSAVGRLLLGCSTVAGLVACLRYEWLPAPVRLLACAAWVLSLLFSVFEGGRNTIAVNLIFLLAAGLVRRRCGRPFLPFGPSARFRLKIAVLVVAAYSLFVFVERFTAIGYTDQTVIDGIERAYCVKIDTFVDEIEPSPLKNVVLGSLMLMIYIAHGVDQIGGLFNWMEDNSLGFGRYNLDLIVLTLGKVGLAIERFPFYDLPQPGLYVTAIGELFLDAGLVGTLICLFVIGLLMGRLWHVAPRGKIIVWELVLCFGLGWLMTSPLYSIISGFLGVILAIFAFHGAILLQRALRFKY